MTRKLFHFSAAEEEAMQNYIEGLRTEMENKLAGKQPQVTLDQLLEMREELESMER